MEKKLYNCQSISELLTMYFGLGIKEKQSIFNEEIDITEERGKSLIKTKKGIRGG